MKFPLRIDNKRSDGEGRSEDRGLEGVWKRQGGTQLTQHTKMQQAADCGQSGQNSKTFSTTGLKS